MPSQTQEFILTSLDLDKRVDEAIASAFERQDAIAPNELAIIVECAQRMIEVYDLLLDSPPLILPALSESGVDFIMEKLDEHTKRP